MVTEKAKSTDFEAVYTDILTYAKDMKSERFKCYASQCLAAAEAVNSFLTHTATCYFLAPGNGKTFCNLLVIAYLQKNYPNQKVVMVVPSELLKKVVVGITDTAFVFEKAPIVITQDQIEDHPENDTWFLVDEVLHFLTQETMQFDGVKLTGFWQLGITRKALFCTGNWSQPTEKFLKGLYPDVKVITQPRNASWINASD